ncbi:EpsG family protein [Cetobacterium sp.]|uniref:EpsG family protein n=1 Tax=Cetobacterium sp. TaxID=2071632 RepID=UPI003F402C6B
MLSYLVFFYTCFLFSCLEKIKEKYLLKIFLFIFYIIIFGFRNKIGVDWYNYEYFYTYFNGFTYLKEFDIKMFIFSFPNMDIGFKIISLFLFGNSEFKLLFINILLSIFICLSLNRFIKKDEVLKKYYFSYITFFMVFYFFIDVDIIRQSIVFYSFLYTFDILFENKVKFLKINFLVGAVHIVTSYLNLFFIIILKKIKVTRIRIIFITINYIAFKTLNLSTYINKFLIICIERVNFHNIKKIKNYLNIESQNNINFSFILNVFILLCLVYYYKKVFKKNTREEYVLKMFLWMIILESILANYQVAVNRFNYYYRFTIPYLIIYMIDKIIKKKLKIIFIIIITWIYLTLRMLIFFSDLNNRKVYLPYSNYLFKTDENDNQLREKRIKIENKEL